MHSIEPMQATELNNARTSGFTLIELSIVLVIIGLIVGGVLVGQDLIAAAQIRATISQVERYNTEVNTFLGKFNGMPGDIPAQTASNFGNMAVLSGAEGVGDGNSIIEDGNLGAGGPNDNFFAGEISTFWRHLTDATMIDGGFGTGATLTVGANASVPVAGDTGVLANAVTTSTLSNYIPPAKLGKGMSFVVFSGSGQNFYGMLPITGIPVSGQYTLGKTGISPVTAHNIDVKLDDGLPNSGTVRSNGTVDSAVGAAFAAPITPANTNALFSPYGMTAPTVNAVAAANTCTMGTGIASDTYNINITTGGNDPSCALTFKFN